MNYVFFRQSAEIVQALHCLFNYFVWNQSLVKIFCFHSLARYSLPLPKIIFLVFHKKVLIITKSFAKSTDMYVMHSNLRLCTYSRRKKNCTYILWSTLKKYFLLKIDGKVWSVLLERLINHKHISIEK